MAEGEDNTLGTLNWDAHLRLASLGDDIAEADRRVEALYDRHADRAITVRVRKSDGDGPGDPPDSPASPGGRPPTPPPDPVQQVIAEARAPAADLVARPVKLDVDVSGVERADEALAGLNATADASRQRLAHVGDEAARAQQAVALQSVPGSVTVNAPPAAEPVNPALLAQAAELTARAADAAATLAANPHRLATAPASDAGTDEDGPSAPEALQAVAPHPIEDRIGSAVAGAIDRSVFSTPAGIAGRPADAVAAAQPAVDYAPVARAALPANLPDVAREPAATTSAALPAQAQPPPAVPDVPAVVAARVLPAATPDDLATVIPPPANPYQHGPLPPSAIAEYRQHLEAGTIRTAGELIPPDLVAPPSAAGTEDRSTTAVGAVAPVDVQARGAVARLGSNGPRPDAPSDDRRPVVIGVDDERGADVSTLPQAATAGPTDVSVGRQVPPGQATLHLARQSASPAVPIGPELAALASPSEVQLPALPSTPGQMPATAARRTDADESFQGVAPRTAEQVLRGMTRKAPWGGDVEDPNAQEILRSPHAQELLSAVPPGSTALAAGASSVVLATPDGQSVVRLGPTADRPAIPEVLQPTARTVAGGYMAETLPRVQTDGITNADVEAMRGQLASRGYEFSDPGTDNLGRTPDGRLVVTDAGEVSKFATPPPAVDRRPSPAAPRPPDPLPGYRGADADDRQSFLGRLAAAPDDATRVRFLEREARDSAEQRDQYAPASDDYRDADRDVRALRRGAERLSPGTLATHAAYDVPYAEYAAGPSVQARRLDLIPPPVRDAFVRNAVAADAAVEQATPGTPEHREAVGRQRLLQGQVEYGAFGPPGAQRFYGTEQGEDLGSVPAPGPVRQRQLTADLRTVYGTAPAVGRSAPSGEDPLAGLATSAERAAEGLAGVGGAARPAVEGLGGIGEALRAVGGGGGSGGGPRAPAAGAAPGEPGRPDDVEGEVRVVAAGQRLLPGGAGEPPEPDRISIPGGGGGAAAGATGGAGRTSGGGIPRGFGRILSYYAATRAGLDTAEAAGDAFAAAGSYDPAEQAQDVAAGQSAIRRIPLVGGLVEGAGSLLYRAGSAGVNFITGRGAESDAAYGERVQREVATVEPSVAAEQGVVQGTINYDRGVRQRFEAGTASPGADRQTIEVEQKREADLRESDQLRQREQGAARATEAAQDDAALTSARGTVYQRAARFAVNNPLTDFASGVVGPNDPRRAASQVRQGVEGQAVDAAQPELDANRLADTAAERIAKAAADRRAKQINATADAAERPANIAEAEQRQATSDATAEGQAFLRGANDPAVQRQTLVDRQARDLAAARNRLPVDAATGRPRDISTFTSGTDPITGETLANVVDPTTGRFSQAAADYGALRRSQGTELGVLDVGQQVAQQQRSAASQTAGTIALDDARGDADAAGRAGIEGRRRAVVLNRQSTAQDVADANALSDEQGQALGITEFREARRTVNSETYSAQAAEQQQQGLGREASLTAVRQRFNVDPDRTGADGLPIFTDILASDPYAADKYAARRRDYSAATAEVDRGQRQQVLGLNTQYFAGQASLNNDPLGAAQQQRRGDFYADVGATGPDDPTLTTRLSTPTGKRLLRNEQQGEQLDQKRHDDLAGTIALDQNTQEAVLNAELYRGPGGERGDPEGARVAAIVGRAKQESRALSLAGQPAAAARALSLGGRELDYGKQEYLDSFHAVQIDSPSRIDFGNPRNRENVSRSLHAYDQGHNQLGQDAAGLAGGKIVGGGIMKIDPRVTR